MERTKKGVQVFKQMHDRVVARYAEAKAPIRELGLIFFISFPLFYWLWTSVLVQPYESLALRMTGSLLGLGLFCTSYAPLKWHPWVAWIWLIALTYLLPFFFAYYFLMNEGTMASVMALFCSIFLLVLLVDVYAFIFMTTIGWLVALLSYDVSVPEMYFGQEHIEIVLILVFVIIAGLLLAYKQRLFIHSRLNGMAAAAGTIAHELRTPLLSIKSGVGALEQYVPHLLQAYEAALTAHLIEPIGRKSRMVLLNEALARVNREVDYANTMIDMLLFNAGRGPRERQWSYQRCSIHDVVSEALGRYPFKSEAARAQVNTQRLSDFQFWGEKVLMEHVIFNLLKNALSMIAKAGRGEIEIWTQSDLGENRLYFKDTACGMSQHELTRLFNYFYSTTLTGTGLGLSFCRQVLEDIGGGISCEAREGEYTLFILTFPILHNHDSL